MVGWKYQNVGPSVAIIKKFASEVNYYVIM